MALGGAACSSGSATSTTSGPAPFTVVSFSVPGPYAAGTARYTLPSGDQLQVWYPVDKAAVKGMSTYTYQIKSWVPASLADNPALASLPDTVPTSSYLDAPISHDTSASGDTSHAFPVVIFAHGYGSYPEQSSFLTDHLATWGFVVAPPDEQTTDLASVISGSSASGSDDAAAALGETLSFLKTQDATSGGRLDHLLDFTKVGAVGHSLGGGATITLAGNPVIKTYAALAPVPGTPPTGHKPGLAMYGSSDMIVAPASVQKTYASLPTPKRLIVIKDGGHNVFDDICTIHSGSERLVAILKASAGSPGGFGALATLATDGCFPPDVDPVNAFPMIDQAVTAQMRDGLGIDSPSAGFGPGIGTAFPGVSASYSSTT